MKITSKETKKTVKLLNKSARETKNLLKEQENKKEMDFTKLFPEISDKQALSGKFEDKYRRKNKPFYAII